jgi:hypothetical protein
MMPRATRPVPTKVASIAVTQPAHRRFTPVVPPNGTIRACPPQRAELARHRVVTGDGRDLAVATVKESRGYLTGIYPVQQGYLVMMYQPLYEARNSTANAAREHHEEVVQALAEFGLRIVRARRRGESEHKTAQETAIAAGETSIAAEAVAVTA